jgi:uncharacterized metal-binding protein
MMQPWDKGNQLAPCNRKSITGELSSASVFRDISLSVCATGMQGGPHRDVAAENCLFRKLSQAVTVCIAIRCEAQAMSLIK